MHQICYFSTRLFLLTWVRLVSHKYFFNNYFVHYSTKFAKSWEDMYWIAQRWQHLCTELTKASHGILKIFVQNSRNPTPTSAQWCQQYIILCMDHHQNFIWLITLTKDLFRRNIQSDVKRRAKCRLRLNHLKTFHSSLSTAIIVALNSWSN